jgi:hypothetical protein
VVRLAFTALTVSTGGSWRTTEAPVNKGSPRLNPGSFASVAVTVAASAYVWAGLVTVVVHVQTNVTAVPAAIARGRDGVTPGPQVIPVAGVTDGTTALTLAVATPAAFCSVSRTVIAWVRAAVIDGAAATPARSTVNAVAVTTGLGCTVTAFELTGPAESVAPEFAAVPLAAARKVSVPAAEAV